MDIAKHNGIVADKNQIWVTDTSGNSWPQPTARVKGWLPGDDTTVEVIMILGDLPTNILRLDLLKGHPWVDLGGKEWVFDLPPDSV